MIRLGPPRESQKTSPYRSFSFVSIHNQQPHCCGVCRFQPTIGSPVAVGPVGFRPWSADPVAVGPVAGKHILTGMFGTTNYHCIVSQEANKKERSSIWVLQCPSKPRLQYPKDSPPIRPHLLKVHYFLNVLQVPRDSDMTIVESLNSLLHIF